MRLPTDKIQRRADARPIVEEIVTGLMDSIVAGDLINPIRVRPVGDGWEATAGGHRLEAHIRLGLVEIECDVREEDDRAAELAMIDENIFRGELSAADRAKYLARRKELYNADHPDSRTKEAARLAPEARAPRFTQHVAEVTGQSEKAVQLDVERGNKIAGEVLDLVRGTSLDTGTYLDKLKKLPASEQFQAATRDLAHLNRRGRENERNDIEKAKRSKIQGDVKARAAKEVADMMAEHVPAEWWDALKSNLYAAGASNIAHELTNITGQSVMDRGAA